MFPIAAVVLGALLLLNEVMVRPSTGGSEWVEIVNAGDEPAPIAGLKLEDARVRPAVVPAGTAPIEPGGFRLLAATVAKVLEAYPSLDPAHVLDLDGTWPTLNDADGSSGWADVVLLRSVSGAVIDSFAYDARWLGPAGVSIERVDTGAATVHSSNWSPSTDDSLATPLRVNSLSLTPVERDRGALLVPLEPVPVEGSDRALIAWHLDEPAAVTIELFDLAGRPVRLLKPLEESATVGRVAWDLNDDLGRPVPTGVYLVLLEGRYPDDREMRRWRKPLVVARSGR